MTRAVSKGGMAFRGPRTQVASIGSEHLRLMGDDDEDEDAGTDTTVPDDDVNDIASITSQQTTAIQTSNL